MKTDTPLLYRPVEMSSGRHIVAACRDIPSQPCWHATCGTCRMEDEPDKPWQATTHADAVAWLARHLRDKHGAAL